ELMLVCGKGFAGTDFAADMAELGITAVLPARRDEEDPGVFPAWLRQRIESVNWTLKGQLGLEDHGGHVLSGCGPACMCSRYGRTHAASRGRGEVGPSIAGVPVGEVLVALQALELVSYPLCCGAV